MNNMVRLSFRVPPEMLHAIQEEAAKRGLVLSDIVRMSINVGLPIIQGNEPETLKKTNELLEKMLRIMSSKEETEIRREGF